MRTLRLTTRSLWTAALIAVALLAGGCGERTGSGADALSAASGPSPTDAPSRSDPPPTEPTSTPSPAPPLPTDLDLMAGLPADGGDYDVLPQSPAGEGIPPVVICDEQVWPSPEIEGVRRLVTTASGPEHFEGRELLSLPTEAEATYTMDLVRTLARTCRHSDNRVWTRIQKDTGHDTVTVGLTYTDGLGSSVFQMTRIGSVLLLVTTYGEGTIASLPQQAADVTRTTDGIIRQLCALAATGC